MSNEREDWIANLKVGDSVYTIERSWKLPNEQWKWKSTIVAIEPSYIETVFQRERGLDWLEKEVEKLAPHHRTYERTWSKNYFASDGTINIEEL